MFEKNVSQAISAYLANFKAEYTWNGLKITKKFLEMLLKFNVAFWDSLLSQNGHNRFTFLNNVYTVQMCFLVQED